MEEKWMWIAAAVVSIMIGAISMFNSYQKNQCRISYIESNRDTKEIAELCR